MLEPRSNTMKRGVMKDALPGSLARADRVFIYTAGLGWDARVAVRAAGRSARAATPICESLVAAWPPRRAPATTCW